jgi:Zn-dependent protease with chaperone function
MKGTLAWILIASPFVLGAAILIADFLYLRISKWRERQAIERRNAKLVRMGFAPFRGTKDWMR